MRANTITEIWLARQLDDYLRRLIALSPHSIAGRLADGASISGHNAVADQLAERMDLMEHAAEVALWPCTPRQQRILLRRHIARIAEPVTSTNRLGAQTVIGCQSRAPKQAELAAIEGITQRQYRSELERALRAVEAARKAWARRQRKAA